MPSLTQFLPLLFILALVYLFLRSAYNAGMRRQPSTAAVSPFLSIVANPSALRRRRNPANDYEEEIGTLWLWCLLFGCIYFAARGVWTHAVAALLLAIFKVGFSWLIYPLFARQIIETHYLRRGWLPVS